jgi:hypothetical protein
MTSYANPSKVRKVMKKEVARISTERTKLGLRYNTATNALALLDGGFLKVEQVVDFMKLSDKYHSEINEGRLDFNDVLNTLKTDYGLDLNITIE